MNKQESFEYMQSMYVKFVLPSVISEYLKSKYGLELKTDDYRTAIKKSSPEKAIKCAIMSKDSADQRKKFFELIESEMEVEESYTKGVDKFRSRIADKYTKLTKEAQIEES